MSGLVSKMVFSRLKYLPILSTNARRCFSTSKQLSSGAHAIMWYRTPRPPPRDKRSKYAMTFIMSFMWWWVFWHMWTDYEHITGEFEYPDPAKWTDEELGIPPDDVEE